MVDWALLNPELALKGSSGDVADEDAGEALVVFDAPACEAA